MSRVPGGARRLSWAPLTLVLLALLLAVAACDGADGVASPSSTALSPLLGYWRVVDESDTSEVHLILIAREAEAYTIDLPPFYPARELTVAGDRLELRDEVAGETVYLAVFSLEPGEERLAQAHYVAAPFSGDPAIVTYYERAEGSADELAEELRQWWANTTAQEQVETLGYAIGRWRADFGRLPTRAEMRPGGAFWQWPQAPEIVNAFTGQPLDLGEGPGEFSYERSATGGSFTLTIHLFGGGESSWIQ